MKKGDSSVYGTKRLRYFERNNPSEYDSIVKELEGHYQRGQKVYTRLRSVGWSIYKNE